MASEHENALDQHVAHFLRKHPEFFKQHTISKIQPGCYNLDNRHISVEWHYAETGEDGYLVVVDGPLRQAFADYVQGTEANAQFDNQLPRSSLQQVPRERQLSFGNMHKEVSRLESMKIAKEQALVREMAAEYAKDGHRVPESLLIERYKKTIDKKLGNHCSRQTKTGPVPVPLVAAPVAVAPEPVQPSWWPQAQTHGQSDGWQNGHPVPMFCSKHDATEKRKKIAPRNAECTTCKEAIQTNYAEFSVCHACSRRESRCLCCGDRVAGQQQQCQGQDSPSYCSKHDQSGKREKTQPRNVECASCKVIIQTNYVDFSLCAPCSQAEQRCLCCGAGTAIPSAPLPSTVSGIYNPCAGIGFPNLGCPPLPGSQMLPNQAMNRLPSQCVLTPTPVAAHNPMAFQNMFASFNHMASANRMMAQKAF